MILPPHLASPRRDRARMAAAGPGLTQWLVGAGGFLVAAGLLLFTFAASVR